MRNIIWSRPDGGVSVTILVEATDPAMEAMKLKARGDVPMDWLDVGHDQPVPVDRTFRDAWTWATDKIDHDMAKAREIHRDHLRILRVPLLVALDTDYLRADESKDDALKAEIAAKKQALRDATEDPAIEAAMTPEELKLVIPEALKQG